MCLFSSNFNFFHKLCCTKQNKQHKIKNSAICTYEQCLPSGYTENGANQEFKSTKTSQTHCFGKLKRLASSTVLVYQNSSFSTVLALQKGVKLKNLHDISDVHERIMYMVACLLMENNIQQKSISSNRFFK